MAKRKNCRQLKVHRSSGYQYQDTPAIVMKGNWLKEYGFDSDTAINVECENGKLITGPLFTDTPNSRISKLRDSAYLYPPHFPISTSL